MDEFEGFDGEYDEAAEQADVDRTEYYTRCHEVNCLACKIQAWAVEAELRKRGWHLSKDGEFCPDHADYPAHQQLVARYQKPTLRQSQSDALLEYYDERIATAEQEFDRYRSTMGTNPRWEPCDLAIAQMQAKVADLKAERSAAEMIETIKDSDSQETEKAKGFPKREPGKPFSQSPNSN